MTSSTTTESLDEIEFLSRSDHRVTALSALARRPQSRDDLRVMTGVSRSTIGRTLRAFEDRNWIRREGAHYEATELGGYVAAGVRELIDRIALERELREIWQWLPGAADGFAVDLVADAVVTVAAPDDPYRPVNRFAELLRDTERLRFLGFELALLEPCRDELCRQVVDGMRTEFVDPPAVVSHIRSTYPERFSEAFESGNLTVRVHDDLPDYGVGILDDRIAVAGYDPASGAVKVLVDTDAPAAREWAESAYDAYRRTLPTLAIERPSG